MKKFWMVLLSVTFLFGINTFCMVFGNDNISPGVMKNIEMIADSPSYFDIAGMKRKSREERINDNVQWYKQNGSVNSRYNLYGLDIADFRYQKDFLTDRNMHRWDVHHNNVNPYKYAYMTVNKYSCDTYLRNICPEYLPNLYFVLKGDKIIYPSGWSAKSATDALSSLVPGRYVKKPADGSCGRGIYAFEKKDDKIYVNNICYTYEQFVSRNRGGEYLIQECMTNHRDIAKFNPTCGNTVRIATTRFENNVHVLAAELRLGVKKNEVTDNFSLGGTCVGININTGKLMKFGCYKNKKAELEHPLTHIKYEGEKLPFWNETVNLVKRLHEHYKGLSSIGWDIIITENGPIVIELNNNFSLEGIQACNGGLLKRWNECRKAS